ncbi:MAG: hypothetical protein ABI693_16665 [Bryobacteraceae bacterium]
MSNVLATDTVPEHTSLGALSPAQARAAITLAHGGTVTAAAVHHSTIYNWYENDTHFQCAIKEIFGERNRRLLDQMRELDALALPRAATAVLNRPVDQHGEDAWRLPHMESLGATIHCRPDVLDTPEFDAHSHAAATATNTTRRFSTELDTESAFAAPVQSTQFDTIRHNRG